MIWAAVQLLQVLKTLLKELQINKWDGGSNNWLRQFLNMQRRYVPHPRECNMFQAGKNKPSEGVNHDALRKTREALSNENKL